MLFASEDASSPGRNSLCGYKANSCIYHVVNMNQAPPHLSPVMLNIFQVEPDAVPCEHVEPLDDSVFRDLAMEHRVSSQDREGDLRMHLAHQFLAIRRHNGVDLADFRQDPVTLTGNHSTGGAKVSFACVWIREFT